MDTSRSSAPEISRVAGTRLRARGRPICAVAAGTGLTKDITQTRPAQMSSAGKSYRHQLAPASA